LNEVPALDFNIEFYYRLTSHGVLKHLRRIEAPLLRVIASTQKIAEKITKIKQEETDAGLSTYFFKEGVRKRGEGQIERGKEDTERKRERGREDGESNKKFIAINNKKFWQSCLENWHGFWRLAVQS
jgi:hypothetical protein